MHSSYCVSSVVVKPRTRERGDRFVSCAVAGVIGVVFPLIRTLVSTEEYLVTRRVASSRVELLEVLTWQEERKVRDR